MLVIIRLTSSCVLGEEFAGGNVGCRVQALDHPEPDCTPGGNTGACLCLDVGECLCLDFGVFLCLDVGVCLCLNVGVCLCLDVCLCL